MDVAVSTSDLNAQGSLIENTSAEMPPPVARQANAGKLGGRKPDLESPLGRPNMKKWLYRSRCRICDGQWVDPRDRVLWARTLVTRSKYG